MCGRYGNYRSKMDYENALAKAGGLSVDPDRGPPEIAPNYNITPTQAAWVARTDDGGTWLEPLMWGLVPRWAKDPKDGMRPINARAEALETARSGYAAFGCGSPDLILLIPIAEFSKWLEGMNVTSNENRNYWHVQISEEDTKPVLVRRKGYPRIDLSKYRI